MLHQLSTFSSVSVVRHFQEYTEPSETATSGGPRRTHPNPLHPAASNTDEEKVLLPLGETTLTNNLGIPIVVVVTKVCCLSNQIFLQGCIRNLNHLGKN